MALFLGSSEPDALYVGGSLVDAVYLGSTQLWPSSVRLAGSLEASSSLSGQLGAARPLAAELVASSALVGALAVQRPLSGSLETVSEMSGDLSVFDEVLFEGELTAVSTVAGEISVLRRLSGALVASTSLTGAASIARGLSGSMAAVSALSGAARVARPISGTLAAASAMTGDLTVDGAASVSFITSVTVDAATITMPTVQTGDFVLFIDTPARTNSGTPPMTPVTPTGLTFTALLQFPITGDDGGATRNVISYWAWGRIIADGATESGAVITGSNTGATAGFRRKMLLVFHRTPAATGFGSAESPSKVWSTGDPVATSSDLSVGTAPFIAIAGYRGESPLVSPTFSETADGNVLSGTTAQTSYKIYNSASGAILAADQGDGGSSQLTVSFLVEIS